jgi:hypothetical protein
MIKGTALHCQETQTTLRSCGRVMSGIITGPYFRAYFHQPSRSQIGTMVAILEVGAFGAFFGVHRSPEFTTCPNSHFPSCGAIRRYLGKASNAFFRCFSLRCWRRNTNRSNWIWCYGLWTASEWCGCWPPVVSHQVCKLSFICVWRFTLHIERSSQSTRAKCLQRTMWVYAKFCNNSLFKIPLFRSAENWPAWNLPEILLVMHRLWYALIPDM